MSKQKLKAISGKLKKASKAHAGQAEQIDKISSAMKLRRFPKGSKGHQKRKEKVGKFIETGIQKSINLVNKIRKSPTSVATGLAGLKKQEVMFNKVILLLLLAVVVEETMDHH